MLIVSDSCEDRWVSPLPRDSLSDTRLLDLTLSSACFERGQVILHQVRLADYRIEAVAVVLDCAVGVCEAGSRDVWHQAPQLLSVFFNGNKLTGDCTGVNVQSTSYAKKCLHVAMTLIYRGSSPSCSPRTYAVA